jgi:hypothetical protein
MSKANIRMLNGYRLVYRPEHPKAMASENWLGYVYEHIALTEDRLGRSLGHDEVVHHLDEVRSNNVESNLVVLTRAEHTRLHNLSRLAVLNSDWKIGCKVCGGKVVHGKTYCSNRCRGLELRNPRPSAEALKNDMASMTFVAIGGKYGVSDNSIRKWARAYSLL